MKNEIQPGLDGDFQLELDKLEACGNLRVLPETCSDGKWIEAGGRRMLNLSSNVTVADGQLPGLSGTGIVTGFVVWSGECTGVQQWVSHEYGDSSGGDRCEHADFSRQISTCESD